MSNSIVERVKYLIQHRMNHHLGAVVIDDNTLLFEGGLNFDSFCAVELISVTEEYFHIEYEDEDLKEEHFKTPRALAELLQKLGAI